MSIVNTFEKYVVGLASPIENYLRNADTDFTQLDETVMGVSSKDKKKVKQKIDAAVKKIDSAMQDELQQDTV